MGNGICFFFLFFTFYLHAILRQLFYILAFIVGSFIGASFTGKPFCFLFYPTLIHAIRSLSGYKFSRTLVGEFQPSDRSVILVICVLILLIFIHLRR
ncbi:MAG: hypothetical protein NC918_05325 [Candidatus Omnitrophica bacterium]|nr:hypothetical protein [Candidatus Omnitrophota bacterium]